MLYLFFAADLLLGVVIYECVVCYSRHVWRQCRRSKRSRHCTVFLWFVELFF